VTAPMPDECLAEIEALAAAATPGPWEAMYFGDRIVHWLEGGDFEYVVDEPVANVDNARFIAAARTAIPRLVAEIRRLRADLAAADDATNEALLHNETSCEVVKERDRLKAELAAAKEIADSFQESAEIAASQRNAAWARLDRIQALSVVDQNEGRP
jgi:hypothetical protein